MAVFSHHIPMLIFFLVVFKFSVIKSILGLDAEEESSDEILDDISKDLSDTYLRNLFRKIEKNKDGVLSFEEVKMWVTNVRSNYAIKMAKKRILEYDRNDDGLVSMDEYIEYIYGNVDYSDLSKRNRDQILQSKEKDIKRWRYADFNQDESLSLYELAAFENPEDYEEMKDYNVEETFQNLDSDRDGKVSLNEYLGSEASSSVAADEIDFRERYFKILKDRDKDGFLDMVEVRKWLYRSFPSRIDIETSGFMQQIDGNKDKCLNQKEMLKNWDKFKKFYPNLQNTLLEHDEL